MLALVSDAAISEIERNNRIAVLRHKEFIARARC